MEHASPLGRGRDATPAGGGRVWAGWRPSRHWAPGLKLGQFGRADGCSDADKKHQQGESRGAGSGGCRPRREEDQGVWQAQDLHIPRRAATIPAGAPRP